MLVPVWLASVLGVVWLPVVLTLDQCHCSDRLLFSGTRSMFFCGRYLNNVLAADTCDPTKLYLCTRGNQTATPVALCPKARRSSNNCNDSFLSRNHCLRLMKCSCRGNKFRRDQMVCGQSLQGSDCQPNVLYQCRLLGSPVPMDTCQHGCLGGKCQQRLVEVDNDLEDNKPSQASAYANSSQPHVEHEVEFVTFAPLIGIHINP